MTDYHPLLQAIRQEAERAPFPVDYPVYESARKNALDPILFGGTLKGQICFFGRDLGADEVRLGQPLIGAAGRMVRGGFFEAWQGRRAQNSEELNQVCQRILLTNTVPYKPPGNKAYAQEVKERFRPFIEQLLVCHWQGKHIITLGTEAFKWFAPYGQPGQIEAFFRGGNRFQTALEVAIRSQPPGGKYHQRIVKLMPLPHPSPLNQRYYAQFPHLLQQRLMEIAF